MKNFRELKIWNLGMELVFEVYQLVKELPEREKYGITAQITRAVVSIPSNIAEGSSRSSEKDIKRFLEIALGSAFEVETQMLILNKLKLVREDKIEKLITMIHEEQKMINGLISKLSTKPKAKS